MAHNHGPDYSHDHEGGDVPHDHRDAEPVELDSEDVGPGALPEDEDSSAVEAIASVAEHALDVVDHVVSEHEETDRVEAQAEAIEALAESMSDVAEEQSEAEIADTVEEAGDDSPDTPDADSVGGPPEMDGADSGVDDDSMAGVSDGDGEPGPGEPTAVSVPPQIHDAPRAPAAERGGARTVSKFRSRRTHRR